MKTIILPESKLNELAQQVSQSMLSQHQIDQGIIRGEQLKQFAPHKQINKFLIFQVYQVWEMQINKLNHPYFNLEHPDILSTLQALKNQISQHIEISEEDFRPMLERAVYNNIKLLVDPKASFNSFFFAQKETLPIHVYQRFSQFFADMDFIVNSILRYYQKNQIQEVDKEVFFSKMEKVIEVYNRKSSTGFDAYRSELFGQITGRQLEEVLAEAEKEEEARLAEEEARKQAEEEAKRKEEEAKKQAEEAERQKEEAERIKAEEEARKKAEEEARKQAEEEARLKAEEEKRKAEEAAKKMSFFDTISVGGDSFFDLDEEEDTGAEETEEEVASEEDIDVALDETETVVEEAIEEVVEEQVEEVVEETEELTEEVEEVAELVEEAKEEVSEEVEDIVEEVAEEVEEVVEEATEEVSEELEEVVEEVAEEVAEVEETDTDLDEEEFQEMAESMEPEAKEEDAPMSILDKVSSQQNQRSTYLDKFLNKQSNGVSTEEVAEEVEETVAEEVVEPVLEEVETVEEVVTEEVVEEVVEEVAEESNPSAVGETIFDRVAEKPVTIADQFQTNQTQQETPVHDTLNGNRKIKLDEIPIHKQYQYVQKVFDGNNVRFRIIVDKVNNAKNKVEVEDILNKFVLSNESLDQGDGVVSEFIDLLRNRF